MRETRSGGLLGSLRCVLDTAISIVKNRVELATIELKEEKSRLISAGIWGGVFIFSSIMAIIAITCTLMFRFWDQRLYVAIGLLVFCLIACGIGFFSVKNSFKKPFAETIAQFKKDRAWLQGKK